MWNHIKYRLFAKRFSIVEKVLHLLEKALWESTKIMLRFRIPKPRITAIYATESELCCFNFTGLNTGWKLGPPNPVRYDSKEHVLQPRIAKIFIPNQRFSNEFIDWGKSNLDKI